MEKSMSETMGLTDILKKIHKDTDSDNLKVGEVVKTLEHRGYGALLLAPALLTVMPTGGIPGVPTITGILTFFIAVQILAGKKSPWLPEIIAKRSIKKEKFEKARKKMEPYTKKFDHLIKPRLEILSKGIGARVVAALCTILALFLPPLEIVPFAAMLPALAIALLAVGLSAHDGVVILIGFFVAVAGLGAGIYWLV
jgi:hypothetical protein